MDVPILSAIDDARTHNLEGIFVLAGDLANITPVSISAILTEAARIPNSWAVLASTTDLEPCIGIYRIAMIDPLSAAVRSGKPALFQILNALPDGRLATCPINPAEAKNVNTPADLG